VEAAVEEGQRETERLVAAAAARRSELGALESDVEAASTHARGAAAEAAEAAEAAAAAARELGEPQAGLLERRGELARRADAEARRAGAVAAAEEAVVAAEAGRENEGWQAGGGDRPGSLHAALGELRAANEVGAPPRAALHALLAPAPPPSPPVLGGAGR
jgi:hypothetical protein